MCPPPSFKGEDAGWLEAPHRQGLRLSIPCTCKVKAGPYFLRLCMARCFPQRGSLHTVPQRGARAQRTLRPWHVGKDTDHLLLSPQMEVDAEEKRHRTRSKGVRGTSTLPGSLEAPRVTFLRQQLLLSAL